ncbi:DNA-binding protein inhibitor ID-2 [Sceloporus undulatus]|uniref:DNA-binding protein inhibitor ID-2 n=1 Tax=Sceloporus undulatus TaxID=8520 RepID=UPI001C4AC087|nr:DNA-binding protein inhibitor ID-2 [Sceloporus undulatus]
MKALSPGRPSSVRRGGSVGGSLLSEPGLGIISRGGGGKGSASSSSSSSSSSSLSSEDPLSLLYNMNDCYSKLKELVPSIPQNKKVSKMEILQHVIDYILDLQIALDTHPAAALVSLHHPRAQGPGSPAASRSPLAALNTDITILSLQAAEFPSELMSNDSKALCG